MKRNYCFMLLLCIIVVSMSGCVKVIKIGDEERLTGDISFEETINVAGFWDSQAVEEVKDNAVELSDFLTRSNGKLDTLVKEYGRYTMESNGEINYAVHGAGVVTEVHDDVKAGYLIVKLDGYEGNENIFIQVGPVFKKTTIRDYLSFLDVNNYTDQIQFAKLSKEINKYIYENVVQSIDIENINGKNLEFYGCFTYDKDDTLLITPVSLATIE